MKISLGTANFLTTYGILNTHINKKNLNDIYKYAKLNNIKYLDTSFEYDKFLKVINDKEKKFLISTKIKLYDSDFTEVYALLKKIKIIESKISKLNLKKFEIFMIHNFDHIKKRNHKKTFDFLYQLKAKKITKKIGVSVYEKKSILNLNKEFLKKIDVIQAPINIFDRKFLEKKIINLKKKYKFELHARSIFLQGLILQDKKKLMKYSFIKNEILNLYKNFFDLNYKEKLDICTNFINYNQFLIDRVIIGIKNKNELKKFMISMKKKSRFNFKLKKNININFIDPRKW